MFSRILIGFLLVVICITPLYAQKGSGKLYRIDRYESIYLPLGKISFADSIVNFTMGFPSPLEIYTDTSQCLHEPDYTNYHNPTFLSLGCKGSLTVAFTDNGFMNLPGDDLYIFEVGPSREAAKIEISANGTDWIYAGNTSGGKSVLDLSNQNISKETVFYFLRITDLKEVCKSKSAGADIDAVGAISSVIKLTINADVLFDTAEYTLKETSKQTLDSISKTIMQIDKATILVEGHTDSDGGDYYNMELSKNRCAAVVDKLKSLFEEGVLYTYNIQAYGENRPKVSNDTDANKQINRRVEITVLPPKDYYDSILKRN